MGDPGTRGHTRMDRRRRGRYGAAITEQFDRNARTRRSAAGSLRDGDLARGSTLRKPSAVRSLRGTPFLVIARRWTGIADAPFGSRRARVRALPACAGTSIWIGDLRDLLLHPRPVDRCNLAVHRRRARTNRTPAPRFLRGHARRPNIATLHPLPQFASRHHRAQRSVRRIGVAVSDGVGNGRRDAPARALDGRRS